jgi:glyoxylase-like metal-dependent hydrolase (beta-lactamase superfamily II)
VSELAVESAQYELVRVAPGVFATVARPEFDPSAFSASMIVVRGDGVLLVDSRGGPGEALELLAQVRAITAAPVRWLVNTHWHEDHVGGNQVFRDSFPDLAIIGGRHSANDVRVRAQQRLEERLARVAGRLSAAESASAALPKTEGDTAVARQRAELADRTDRLTRYLAELREIVLVPPTVEVEDEWRLERTAGSADGVRVISVGPAHTDGDVVVYLPGSEVLAPGDLLEEGLPWYGDGDPAGWAAALARVSDMNFSRLVLSHGHVHTDRSLLGLQQRFVAAAVGAARAASDAGIGVEAATKSASLVEYRDAMTAELHDAASLTPEQREQRFAATVATIFEREYAKHR